MDLVAIKDRIFQDLERPVKQYLVSNEPDVPVEVQYAGVDYEVLFCRFLPSFVSNQYHMEKIDNELNEGAKIFAQEAMSIFQVDNATQFPKALKKIAKNVEKFPAVSNLMMKFYKECIGSVDVVDDFGETAFSKILKADKHRKTPLLFLASHGAKSCTLNHRKQDALMIEYSDIYQSAESNTAQWGNGDSVSPKA
jgi:hypothetical protein